MLNGIKEVAQFTINFSSQLIRLIEETKKDLLSKLPKIYFDGLVEHLFMYPYTKNEIFRVDLNLSRTTATKYLKALVQNGFLEEEKDGKEVLYKNVQIKNLFE
jgi:DNA-binding transcriptional ArsR family regulator